MSDSLLDKLQTLETTLRDVRKRYHINHTELKNLKSKPQVDMAQLNQLKLQLAEVKNSQRSLTQERDTLKEKLAASDKNYQSLAEAHQTLTDKHKALQNECKELKAMNQSLQEKNRTAAEHTKVVLERLKRIDSAEEQ